MLIFGLYPLTIRGRRAWTLKEAAYLIRQYAIDHDDLEGWKLTRILRSAESPSDIKRAENALRTWIQDKHHREAEMPIDQCSRNSLSVELSRRVLEPPAPAK